MPITLEELRAKYPEQPDDILQAAIDMQAEEASMPVNLDYSRESGLRSVVDGVQSEKTDSWWDSVQLPGEQATSVSAQSPVSSGWWDEVELPGAQSANTKSPSDVMAGLSTSFKQLPELGWGLAAIVSSGIESMFGEGGLSTAAKNYSVGKMQDWQQSIAKDSRDVYELDTAINKAKEGDFGALVDWFQYGVGYAIGQGAQILTGAGIGSLGAKVALKPAIEKLAGNFVANEALKLAAGKKVTEAITRQAVANVAGRMGEHAAMAGMALGMEGGEIGGKLAETSVKEGRTLTGEELARGLGATLLAGSMEYGENLLSIGALRGFKPKTMPFSETAGVTGRVGRAVTGAAVAAPVEGATEYFQTGAENYGAGQEENVLPWNQSQEAQREAFNAAGLGAVGGGAYGVIGGVMTGAQQRQPATTTEDILSAPTVDAAIAASDSSVADMLDRLDERDNERLQAEEAAAELQAFLDQEQADLAYLRQYAEERAKVERDYAAAQAQADEERRRAKDKEERLMLEQRAEQLGLTQPQLIAASEAAGVNQPQPESQMQLAMRRAKEKFQPEAAAGQVSQPPKEINDALQVQRQAPAETLNRPEVPPTSQGDIRGPEPQRQYAELDAKVTQERGDVVRGGGPNEQGALPGGAVPGANVTEVSQPSREPTAPVRDAGVQPEATVGESRTSQPEAPQIAQAATTTQTQNVPDNVTPTQSEAQQFDPRPDGTIRVKGYTKEQIRAAADKIGARVIVGNNGNAVFAKGTPLTPLKDALNPGAAHLPTREELPKFYATMLREFIENGKLNVRKAYNYVQKHGVGRFDNKEEAQSYADALAKGEGGKWRPKRVNAKNGLMGYWVVEREGDAGKQEVGAPAVAVSPTNAVTRSQGVPQSGMQERRTVRADESGSSEEPAQSGSEARSESNATSIPRDVQESALKAAREEQDQLNAHDLEQEIRNIKESGGVDLSEIAKNPEYWDADNEEFTDAGRNEVDRLTKQKALDNLRIGLINDLEDLNNSHQFAKVAAMEKLLDGLDIGYSRNYSWSASRYIMVDRGNDVDPLKLRFADHLKTARGQSSPDVNVAPGGDSFMDAVSAVAELRKQKQNMRPADAQRRNEEQATENPTPQADSGVPVTKTVDQMSPSDLLRAAADKMDAEKIAEEKTGTGDTETAAEAKPVATSDQHAEGKIEDFGEKLGGARKDQAAALRDAVTRDLTDDEIASQPLSKIWPKESIDQIEDTFIAAVAHAARAEIPSKPRQSYKVRAWVEKVKTLRGMTAAMLRGGIGRDFMAKYVKEHRGLEHFYTKVKLLESIDRHNWGRIGYVQEWTDSYRYSDDGKTQIPTPLVLVEIDGKRQRYDAASVGDVLDKVRDALGEAQKAKKMEFEVRGRDGAYFINKKGDSLYRKLKSFNTAKEAFDYRASNYDDLVSAWEAVKESDNVKETDVRRAENRPRTAEDWRNGKDVTPEKFQNELGFRGIEFGNWVAQGKNAKERQGMLNQAYDALMDLASIIDVPPKAMSLNGTLGLGFGSRGSGKFAAHFEPDMLVINLTKTRGAGSLAHEWFHALDNYFQSMRGKGYDFITNNPENYYVHKQSGTKLPARSFAKMIDGERDPKYGYISQRFRDRSQWELKEGVRTEVAEAFADLVQALNESPMAKRAGLIDKGQAGGYWSRIIERGARSFENYVIHKMMLKGYHNDYLANVTSIEEFSRDPGRYPYLLEGEIQPVAEAFDNLFATIETKETDSGVAMFNRAEGSQSYSDVEVPDGEARERIDALQEAVRRHANSRLARVSKSVPFDTLARGRGGNEGAAKSWQLAGELARFFGQNVITFENHTPRIFDFNGVSFGGDIFINAKADRPAHVIFGHEFLHRLKAENQQAYDKMMLVIRPMIRNLEGFRKAEGIETGFSTAYAEEELAGNIVGNRFTEQEFWGRVRAFAPKQFKAIIEFALKMLNDIHSLFTGKKTLRGDEFVTDLDKARDAIAEAVATYNKRTGENFTPKYMAEYSAAQIDNESDGATVEAPSPVGEELERAARLFLSAFPKGTIKYGPKSGTARFIRSISDRAYEKVGDKGTASRQIDARLGAFSGYKTEAEIGRDWYGNDRLEISVWGKEQVQSGLDDIPALRIEVSKDGEFNIYGPPSGSDTFRQFMRKGWAEPAVNAEGEQHDIGESSFWTQLTGVNRAQTLELLADIHARTMAWTGKPNIGLHWQRATGATGGMAGRRGAIYFSRKVTIDDNQRKRTPEQLAMFKNVGRTVEVPTIKERVEALRADFWKKAATNLVDQFRPIRDISKEAYGLLRLSKGASGAFEVFMRGGQLKITDGAYDFDETKRGGVVERLLAPLQNESGDFLWWVAANRAEKLAKEDRENLWSGDDIKAGKTLADGVTDFDYTLQHDVGGEKKGTVTRDRTLIYQDALKTFNEFHKNALDLAEQSGLIDNESRSLWESEFYIPFYRVEEDGGFRGMNVKSGAVRQEAFKKLKGGTGKLNSDLLENALMNWAHLIDASAKNRAAKATIDAAEKLEIARQVPSGTKGAVWVQDNGEKKHYVIDDPYVLSAITSLEYAGLKGGIMDALSATKHWLTIGVTASPFFKVRNLIRDSIQVIGTSDISVNPIKNISEGFKATKRDTDEYFRMLAGGGLIRFGTMLEGREADRTRALVEKGVDPSTILDNESKIKAFYKRKLEPLIDAYNELGNRGEEVNRAALYKQLRARGLSHAEASLEARDLMDFSMQGSWRSVRFLTQIVPFLNARMQGLYKLGRAGKTDPARMASVVGAATLVSLALLAAYSDDDDWKQREEWDRNNYWWFKVGGVAFRIPKPFEVGAVATLGERTAEWMFDDEMNGKRFAEQFRQLLSDQLAMNPIPQMFKPILDIYSNKDSFSGRPIETMGMERLAPEYRFRQGTSMIARGVSSAGNAAADVIGADFMSPVQIDHLVRGYFSWLGAFIVGGADMAVRSMSNETTKPTIDYWKFATGGMVAGTEGAASRYVSQVYDQAKELEEAYGTYRSLVSEGKREEANEFLKDNKEKLARYRSVETVKSQLSRINKEMRAIERSNISPDEKKMKLDELKKRQSDVARTLSMRTVQ